MLPSTGKISLGDIRTEFAGTDARLSAYYARGPGIPKSGQIAASQFRGRSALVTRGLVLDVDTKNPACFGSATQRISAVGSYTYTANKALPVDGTDAMYFDGATTLSAGTYPYPADTFSIEAWCNPQATHEIDAETLTPPAPNTTPGTAGQRWITSPSHQGDVNGGAGISVGTNGISVYEHGSNYMPSLLTYQAAISGMTHLMVVYTAKRPALYVNGTLVRTGLLSQRGAVYGNIYGIGYGSYGNFIGYIGCIRQFNVALTASEVAQNYNAYKPYYQ